MDDSVLDAAFSALGDKTRRAILLRLAEGSATVTALAEPFEMSLNAVSKHIKMLERGGLVQREIKGRVHTISLADDHLLQLRGWLQQFAPEPDTKPLESPAPTHASPTPADRAPAQHGGGLLDKLAHRLGKFGR